MSESISSSGSGDANNSSQDTLQAGDQLGGYQLLCPVARGGMGQIWAARRTGRLGTLVAVKTALVETGDTLEALFFDEARVAVSIDHPNVCRTFELGEDHGVLFLAMEWLDGASLWNLVKALPPPRRLDYHTAAYAVARACAGLHAAHELRDDDGAPLNVVHRDATPHNILITRNGDVKVVDFGVVKSRDQLHATVTGEFKGKIHYLAPEQILSKESDRRTDVFALGCVLYVLTTGERPFHADNAGGTMLKIVHGNYTLPSELVPSFPAELETIIVRALAREPDRRFHTADAMRLALESFVETKVGPPIGRDDLAALLQAHLGDSMSRRQEQIRAAQKRMVAAGGSTAAASEEPVGTGLEAGSGSLGTAAPVALSRPKPARRFVLYAVVASLLAAAPFAALRLERAAPPALAAARDNPALPAESDPTSSSASASVARPDLELVAIQIRATPQGAVVVVDDSEPKSTPCTFSVPRDTLDHRIIVRAPGHADQQRTLRFDRNQSLEIALSRSVYARPASAKDRRGRHTDDDASSVSAPASATAAGADPFAQPIPPRNRRTIDESDPFRE